MTTATMPENTITFTADKKNLAKGNYVLVGFDLDITGKKISDDICQVACYTPNSQYSQYVMPYKDVTPYAKSCFNMKVITINRYRMLKDTKANKVIKTRSEVSALQDLITWLETIKNTSDGIILFYHDNRQILPTILLKSLKNYSGLYDKFTSIVKGFINSCDIAKDKGFNTNKSCSLKHLAESLVQKTLKDEVTNAVVRAELVLEIGIHLINIFDENVTENGNTDSTNSKKFMEYINEYLQTIKEMEVIRKELEAVSEREYSLAPIFAVMRRSPRERQQIAPLRRLLAEAKIEYNELEQAWKDNQKEGIEKLVNEKIKNATDREQLKLLSILECHFDKEKAEQLKLELEKKLRVSKKKKGHVKKLDSTNNDSGNDSGDCTLTQSPTKLEVTDANENQIEISA